MLHTETLRTLDLFLEQVSKIVEDLPTDDLLILQNKLANTRHVTANEDHYQLIKLAFINQELRKRC